MFASRGGITLRVQISSIEHQTANILANILNTLGNEPQHSNNSSPQSLHGYDEELSVGDPLRGTTLTTSAVRCFVLS
jgi:hypothetical protein